MKRTASTSCESPLGRDRATPAINSHTLANLPFGDYAAIYLDHMGELNIVESASIRQHRSTLFTPNVCWKFLEILSEEPEITMLDASTRHVRRRLGGVDSESGDCSGNNSGLMLSLCVGDTEKVTDYYKGAFEVFLQDNCNVVLNAFIKFIQPHKRDQHPYNGGKAPRGSAPGTKGDPEKTKPEWWPMSVVHKAPEHLGKESRIKLLLHIIRKLGNQGVTAEKLKEVAGRIRDRLRPFSYLNIIYDILWVREMEERFERGEYGPSITMNVISHEPRRKGGEEQCPGMTRTPMIEGGAKEQGPIAPTSAVEQSDHTILHADSNGSGNDKMTPIRLADTQMVIKYYKGAFEQFQQRNCCTVAKAFIKFIEPHKQVQHPYSGGKPPPGSAQATGDPEETKPEWWPEGVIHKEPDHLIKDYRIKLLLHIIRNLGNRGITAENLKVIAGDIQRSVKPQFYVEILYEILHVRKIEERYERGEIGVNTVVYVKYGGENGGETSADRKVVTPNLGEAINKNVPITSTSTNEQAVTAISTLPSYPLQRSFPTVWLQPGYIPGEVLDSTLFWSSSDQLQTARVP
ncbi:hypothetical protein POX_c04553 [Penicillium oxalicum]|uniref:hypothetical protein n=1 Tax=Penicillium oxalicum TaxID=69781 RepID=UPI0020B63919|nr:hypothetical protein POX_c04553 [Penicillium oxalicum]KAI2791684.1 hypothetical protein POX_c04553 [Penicillium oxalicum]